MYLGIEKKFKGKWDIHAKLAFVHLILRILDLVKRIYLLGSREVEVGN